MATVLRPYQSKIVREVSQAYKNNQLGVLMQSPTGTGKTRTAAYIVEKYSTTGRQVLWLVHREELLIQAAMTFAENGIKHRLVCSTSSERAIKVEEFREFGRSFVDPTSHVIVASIQTIVRRFEKLTWLDPSQIVADEAHLSLADTWRRVIQHFIDKRDTTLRVEYGDTIPQDKRTRLLGLTGTPSRTDKQSFDRKDGGLYDIMVQGPTLQDSEDMGAICKCVVYAPPVKFKSGVKKKMRGGDYDPKMLEEEFDEPVIYGDVIEHYKNLCAGKPAIAFCPTLKVAKKFADEFNARGFKAVFLEGSTDDHERRQALKDLADGKIDVITNVNLLIEGLDVPFATVVIWLRRTESPIVYFQGTGRIRRMHVLKEYGMMLDFVGVTQVHGLPNDEPEWSISGEVKRRPRTEEDEEMPDVHVQTCPKCFAIHKPASECPKCGHIYTIKERKEMQQIAGELVLKTPEQKEAERRAEEDFKRKERYEKKTEESKCKTLEDWIALGVRREYAFPKKWAEHRFSARESKSGKTL